jgi:hypothetical protein
VIGGKKDLRSLKTGSGIMNNLNSPVNDFSMLELTDDQIRFPVTEDFIDNE